MKIKIKSASRGTFWYANQIGSTFNVKVSDIHKDDYMLDENLVDSTLAIKKSDCEIMREESPQPEPFDLERAKKGEPFKMKNGTTFSEFHYFEKSGLLYCIEESTKQWIYNKNGVFNPIVGADNTHGGSEYDLFMTEPEYVEGWVIVRSSGLDTQIYLTPFDCLRATTSGKNATHKIRFPKP